MTNSPDQTNPASVSPTADAPEAATTDAPEVAPAGDDAAPVGRDDVAPVGRDDVAPVGQDDVLDAGTFDRILEPRSDHRLPLGDGTWHQVSPKYIVVQFIANGVVLALVVAAVLILTLVLHQWWAWIPGGVIGLITLVTLAVLPRQARSIGYQLRTDDLVFRRGILWQRMVAVPYGRMQLVDITHGPLDRGFGIAQLKLVTAAAATGVTIPGLTQEAAERLRDTLIDVAETRRTGL